MFWLQINPYLSNETENEYTSLIDLCAELNVELRQKNLH
jgi:hypothetical protein